jgi:4-hydroxymandelate oxidase
MNEIEHATAEQLATLSEVRDAAERALPHDLWDFLESGAGEEQTLADNIRAFARWRFRPRVLTGISSPDPATEFLGIGLKMPVLTAPFGADRLFHPDGHCGVARANAGFGIASVVPEASSFSMEAVADAAPSAARIMQMHPWGTNEDLLERVERAATAGYEFVCLTLDCPTGGWRERGMRNRLVFDFGAIAGNYDLEPLWTALEDGESMWSWERLADVCARLPLPCLVKGILTREDADVAVQAGVAAIIVSNHGGRQLDGAPAALDQLPEVLTAVDGRVPVGVDGGIRRGTDVLKALALGAQVVLIGRLAAYGLAAAGEAGVARVLQLLHAELVTSMTLLGCADVTSLHTGMIQPAGSL